MLLKIQNVEARFGSYRVLRNINLFVTKGEVVTILGANGAGKTTLIKAVISLVKVQKGEIYFDDERIDQLPNYEVIKKGIALCPEGGECFADMSVLKNLLMGALFIKHRAAVEDTYRKVADLFPVLEKRKNQKAGTLSGGERQMLAIGRALMGIPKLLLLDEPSLGLAPIVINDIYRAIERLRAEGLSILLIEQNASKSLKLADRGYVMELGKMILTGSSEELTKDEQVKKAYFGI